MPNEPAGRRDIIIQHRDGPVRRIDEFHRSYDPLHYVLLYPFGTDGWSLAMKLELKITVRQFYAFHQRYRPGHFNIVPRGRRLFQQLLVDAQVRAEADHVNFIRAKQDGLRGHHAESVRGVRYALARFVGRGRRAQNKLHSKADALVIPEMYFFFENLPTPFFGNAGFLKFGTFSALLTLPVMIREGYGQIVYETLPHIVFSNASLVTNSCIARLSERAE